MRENAENASSLINRATAKSVWRRGIAALALVVVGAFAVETTAFAQTRQGAQAGATLQTRQGTQTGATSQTRQGTQTEATENALNSANSASGESEGDGGLSAEAVRSGVDGAIAFLRQKQKPNGEWDEYPGYKPGTTALCALALLSAGLDKDDPTVAKALDFLRGFSPKEQNQTYPISLQTMVFCLADPETDRARIEANVAWLVERQLKTSNEYDGGWSYVGIDQASERADNSNSQFAVLALYEAEQIGVAIDEAIWKRAENYWLRMQNDDGSWGYRASTLNPEGFPSGYGTGSMTCAGIAALAMTSGVREAARARVEGDDFVCCQDVEDEIAVRISSGLNWMGKHFSA
ncbi:MAG: terpene cyclase/mutase family protein, partial [Thermoguttaceae bacterium]|nr:terpene cyclase/mutase family protein [Thermoguttaceae bacterium]